MSDILLQVNRQVAFARSISTTLLHSREIPRESLSSTPLFDNSYFSLRKQLRIEGFFHPASNE